MPPVSAPEDDKPHPDPAAAPSGARGVAGTIIALREHQIWAEDGAGNLLRAWRPATANLSEGREIRLYPGEGDELAGWYDPASGLAVNQCCFDGTAEAQPRQLACQGTCGLVWLAPAAELLLRERPQCLECDGVLKAP